MGEQLFAPFPALRCPSPQSLTAWLPAWFMEVIASRGSVSRKAVIRKATTHPLADRSLPPTFESTVSEQKKDLNHQLDSATSGNPIKEHSY